MEEWRFEGSPKKQMFLALSSVLAGVILVVASSGSANAGIAGLLGVGLALLGAYVFIAGAKSQITTVNFERRRILVEASGLFGAKKTEIPFDSLSDVLVGRLGRSTTAVVFYYLVLKLKDGSEYPLFPPGYFYEGCFDNEVMTGRKDALKKAAALNT